jgi:hypothetical protein
MRYLKSAFAGLAAALVVSVIALPGCLWLSGYMLERKAIARIDPVQGGAEADFMDVNLIPVFGLALAAFAGGFLWKLQRENRDLNEERS